MANGEWHMAYGYLPFAICHRPSAICHQPSAISHLLMKCFAEGVDAFGETLAIGI